ncbi:MAG: hypothetical protein A3K61_01560 [Thaumarchaeota archaeon RBG_16_49_8]|nr:MAG: hypothetical protein A3K61_01560 [Thaumarchaeota archaeon RBG_16_49_8]
MSEEELSFLERASRGRDYKARVRTRMILLSSRNGVSARKIASQLGVHRHTVEERIRRFNESGIDGLKDLPLPGRVPEITVEEKESIFRTALSRPDELGLPYSTWSSSKLRDYLVETGLVKRISSDWVRKLLQKRGFGSTGLKGGL